MGPVGCFDALVIQAQIPKSFGSPMIGVFCSVITNGDLDRFRGGNRSHSDRLRHNWVGGQSEVRPKIGGIAVGLVGLLDDVCGLGAGCEAVIFA